MSGDAVANGSAPDGIEPIVGWRMWMVSPESTRRRRFEADDWLRSLTGSAWVPGERMEAVCVSPGLRRIIKHGEVPELRCRCGVYALQTIDALIPMLGLSAELVVGEVSLWGKIIVHQDGYRAQYAYPRRLWVAGNASDNVQSSLDAYRVPVRTVQAAELRQLMEQRLRFMSPQRQAAAVPFLTGADWAPPGFCPVCKKLMLTPSICGHCDPEAAIQELERLCEELIRRKRQERRQQFAWLYAPQDPIGIPPRLNSEVNKAKLLALTVAGMLMAAAASLLTHPPQGL